MKTTAEIMNHTKKLLALAIEKAEREQYEIKEMLRNSEQEKKEFDNWMNWYRQEISRG